MKDSTNWNHKTPLQLKLKPQSGTPQSLEVRGGLRSTARSSPQPFEFHHGRRKKKAQPEGCINEGSQLHDAARLDLYTTIAIARAWAWKQR